MPVPTPEDFLTGEAKRKREFSRNIGEDWNIRQVGSDLVGTYKPTGANTIVASSGTGGDTAGWIPLTLLNSWVNFGAGFEEAAYRRIGQIIWIRGLVANGVANTIAVLPVDARPSARFLINTDGNGAFARLDVHANGTIERVIGSNVYLSIHTSFALG